MEKDLRAFKTIVLSQQKLKDVYATAVQLASAKAADPNATAEDVVNFFYDVLRHLIELRSLAAHEAREIAPDACEKLEW